MLAAAGPAGFYGTPVTKVLLCHAFITYFLFAFPLQHFQYLLNYDQETFEKRQFKKMILSKLVFLELPDLLFSSLLMYNFRIFERRFGSRKFLSHILSTAVIASALELLVFHFLNSWNIRLGKMPSGMFSLVFPFYISFYCSIPRVALMHIMGVPVTGKTLNYILGLQMASANMENLLVMGCALTAGVLWRGNFLMMKTFLQVPSSVATFFDKGFGRFLESADSTASSLPMGATLELQQQERLDRMEQQMLRTAMQASRRMEIGNPQPLNLSNNLGPGVFGSRNRNSNVNQNPGANDSDRNVPDGNNTHPVSDDQVRRLVEMGFSDGQARQALQAANNNPRLATSFLLQDL